MNAARFTRSTPMEMVPRTSEAVVRFRRFGPSDREQDFSVGLYLALPFHEASGR